MTKPIFAILIFILSAVSAIAQEELTMPAFNPAVATQSKLLKSAPKISTAITLPFYDDFSVISVYPSPLRWVDAFAFINTDYARNAPSIGVATLDALDDKGALYANAGENPFNADYLTSLPIRLDSTFTSGEQKAITRSDSVYLSFYYQPQGRTVSPPSKRASLILEFFSPGNYDTITTASGTVIEPHWDQKWSTDGGIQIDTFAGPEKRYFRQVLIPITSAADSAMYYKNGFQFRFRNIASLKGNSQPDWRNNGSHWNIDIVWLNAGRPFQKDVAFGDQAPSVLQNYESMPFRQYRNNYLNEMKENLNISIANLDNTNQNVTYKFDVRKNSLSPFTEYDGGSGTIKPFFTNGYATQQSFAHPPVNFFFPPSSDEKIVFHIIHTLTSDPNPLFRSNDSIQFDQLFSNYYAYDNGTAEAGVGINGAAGSYAVQFKLNVADTLRGIQIYFNPVIGGANQKLIDLGVWNDAFGKPGQVISSVKGVTPSNTGLNEFVTYWFENPVIVNSGTFPGLIFYIGWTQSFVDNLNVGFDRYKDSHLKRFFNVDGNWTGSDSINYGSVMIRPVVGLVNPLGTEKPIETARITIRPNPVTDGNLIISLPESWKNIPSGNLEINIISATGSRVSSGIFSNPVDVSSLAPGLYIVMLSDKNSGLTASGKLIIR